ncbi:hypothetical protein BGX26_008042, partial [Mortierella sp. AD094]
MRNTARYAFSLLTTIFSGCGKTRSVTELLCLQWGFYFNASQEDLGSDDLIKLADFIDEKASEEQSLRFNTVIARKKTHLLFLSRILILNYCLRVPDCHQTFSSASWVILQTCPNMFNDVFFDLFRKLHDQHVFSRIFDIRHLTRVRLGISNTSCTNVRLEECRTWVLLDSKLFDSTCIRLDIYSTRRLFDSTFVRLDTYSSNNRPYSTREEIDSTDVQLVHSSTRRMFNSCTARLDRCSTRAQLDSTDVRL